MQNKREKFVNFRPMLFLAVSTVLGILSVFFFFDKNILFGILILLIFLIPDLYFFIRFTKGKKKVPAVFCVIFSVFFVIGGAGFGIKVNNFKNADKNNHYYSIEGKISSITDYGDYSSAVLNKVNLIGVNGGKTKYKILVTITGDSDFDIGDYISFEAKLSDRSVYYEGRFSASYIQEKIKYYAYVESDNITFLRNEKNVFEKANVFIRESLKEGMGEDWSIAYAMLTGVTEFMEDETLTNFRNAGVAHIFAVSGLHIGFLASVLYFVLNKLKAKGYLKTFIVVICCFIYSGICGFTASSLRATVMCAVLGFSTQKGERYDPLSSISIACTIILTLFPLQLFMAGFILSFCVVLGIILLSGLILKGLSLPQKIASAIATSLSAEIVSIPVLLVFFNQASVLAIIVNVILIPIISVLFTLVLLSTLIGGVLGIETVLMFPLKYVVTGVKYAIFYIDGKTLLIGGITVGVSALFYYLLLLVLSGVINIKKTAKAITCVVLSLLLVSSTLIINLKKEPTKMCVIGSDNVSATLVLGEESFLIISGAKKSFTSKRFERIKSKSGIDRLKGVIILDTEEETDLQNIATCIWHYFEFDNLFYYGERKEDVEKIIEKSFCRLDLIAVNSQSEFNIGNFAINYALNGKVLEMNYNDKDIAVFGTISKDNPLYKGLTKQYGLIIADGYFEEIQSLYQPKKTISYRINENLTDGESEGNLIFNI